MLKRFANVVRRRRMFASKILLIKLKICVSKMGTFKGASCITSTFTKYLLELYLNVEARECGHATEKTCKQSPTIRWQPNALNRNTSK